MAYSQHFRPLFLMFFHITMPLVGLQAQLVIYQSQNPTEMVHNVLLGSGVFASNVLYNGNPGTQISLNDSIRGEMWRFNGTNTNIGLEQGIVLCTNRGEIHLPGPNDAMMSIGGGPTTAGLTTPDMDLSRLTGWPSWVLGGNNIYSSSILEFDFVPVNDMVSFRYVFSSEEYELWACSQYNDAMGLFISGPGIPMDINGPFTNNAMNIAFIPGSLSAVSINSLNSGLMNASNANGPDLLDPFGECFEADSNWQENAQFYRYNGGQFQGSAQVEEPYASGDHFIQHNGMTTVLTASAAVVVGQSYHIKMAIGNTMDPFFPSAVFIERNSFTCGDRFTLTVEDGPNVNTSGIDPILFENDLDSIHLRFNRWGGFYLDEQLQIVVEGNAFPGMDYVPALPDSIHFNQLDSAVVFPIVVPVRSSEMREITIHLITSNGAKVMTYRLIIAPEFMLGVEGVDKPVREQLSVFPNPAQNTLYVTLPPGTEGRTDLQVLDLAGRMVIEQALNNSTSAALDISQLTSGLYTVMASTQGRISTTRVNVRH